VGAVKDDGTYSTVATDPRMICSVGIELDPERDRMLVCNSDGGAGLLTFIFSQRIYPVQLERRRLVKIILGLILLLVFYHYLPATSEIAIWIGRLLILGLFPVLLFILGFFTPFEMDFIKQLASKTKKMFTSLIVKPT